MYEVYMIMLVYNYDFESMEAIDQTMARILLSAYLVSVSCVCINLYVALLSEAFVVAYSEAAATTILNKAKMLLMLDKRYPITFFEFDEFLERRCSPLVWSITLSYKKMSEKNSLDNKFRPKKVLSPIVISINFVLLLPAFCNDPLDKRFLYMK